MSIKPRHALNDIDPNAIRAKLARYQGAADANGCIPWMKNRDAKGYGRMTISGVTVPAHRAALVAKIGPLASDIEACHTCDNRWCVNADHLFPGTHRENIHDAVRKGRLFVLGARSFPGESSGGAKLKEADVLAIRADRRPNTEIAVDYGVDPSNVGLIKRGRTWRHL